ncbi:hypothetical protein Ctob_012484 [Chrysochromulina tobinii]|uniref:Uncharacterized protein n=1 Tax=Chrysochromulina tobinii TaxID=1460289 RepID=A0A0M0K4V8_9EUKA|nr:hypothetical protein Ctob_012484 [Chrysochromulina tobinii]|eukprot:KOO33855.1 hypothetical protein Ctob_012484 [Chrysochromulina sp. CCMP291]
MEIAGIQGEDLAPVILLILIVSFLTYICCAPGSAPSGEPKDRPHSFSSTRDMLDDDKDD